MKKKLYSYSIKYFILYFADLIMNTYVSYFLRLIKQLEKYSTSDLKAWQFNQLQKLIKHAYNNTEYYKQLFDRHNIDVDKIKNINDLEIIPILSKDDVRNSFSRLLPKNLTNIPHKKSSTGGSSGDPLVYLQSNKSWSYAVANNIINWEKTGYKYGEKFIALGSTSLFVNKKTSIAHSLYYKMKNKIGLNGVNMSNKVCDEYVGIIKKQKIKFIYGYASAIYILAKYVHNNKITLNISACMPTSEGLTSQYKKTIIQAFNCNILNVYGANDGGITAFAFNESCFKVGYNTIVRFKKISEGHYKILLTDLFNYAMPLINYEIGDEVVLYKENNHDYNGQIFDEILGRTSDIITLENGNVLTGPGFTILFKDIPADYYYISKSGVNIINCTIKKLPSYTDVHESIIRSTLAKQIGSDGKLEINYSNDVFYSKSGKRKYFGN